MASKNKYIVFAVIGIAAASGAAWWLQKPDQSVRSEAPADGRGSAAPAGAAAKGGGTGRPVAVEAVAVRQMALRDDAEAVGSLRSRQSVVLRPEVSGRIALIGFADGARVRFDDVLGPWYAVIGYRTNPAAGLSAEARADARLAVGRVLRFGGADWDVVGLDPLRPGRLRLELERVR